MLHANRPVASRLAGYLGYMASAVLLAHAAWPSAVTAQQAPPRHHALSLIGEPAYKPGFKHFDWVNPDAPTGGRVRRHAEGTFDSLNSFSTQGVPAGGIGLIYAQLMSSSADEHSASYGQIAEWVSYPPDYSAVTFGLRATARFSDGRPITPEDVIFSMFEQKKAHPSSAAIFKNVVRGERTGDREVTFHFDVKGNRELPHYVGALTVIPKHFWESRDLTKSTLDVPVGSGPYRIKEVDRGRWIVYERIPDWWGRELPVNRGQWNFDEIRYDYFRERTAAFEQFKAGGVDFWYENSAKSWATEFEFPAAKQGLVKLDKLETKRPMGMQAFIFNLRRPQFRDVRVRRAFNLAFNFEAMNEQLLYSQYFRTSSYFVNSELRSTGLPQGRELEILREVQKQAPEGMPAEVFAAEFKQPVGGADSVHRRNLAEAMKLLREAGWESKGPLLRNAANQPLKVEFLLSSAAFERHVLRYIDDLKKIGIDASLRIVDPAQYQRREKAYDYDMALDVFGQSLSPGNEQRAYWSSQTADQEGGMNTIGVKNKSIDLLVDRVIFAKDRAELVAASRALDRVLLWNHYLVAHWHYPFDRMAYWDKFGRPARMPALSPSFERVWWHDAERSKALAARRPM